MEEFKNLQNQCLTMLQSHESCGQSCHNDFFCKKNGCEECDCSRCLNQIQWGNPPKFTYSCERITYQYALRFFNRFASEICHAFYRFSYNNVSDINVLSLGCGPGSEIYGILRALQIKKSNAVLHYKGYDLSSIWEKFQQISKECLVDKKHEINFYTADLFNDYYGFENDRNVLLLLNYLLSHCSKFLKTAQEKEEFIDKLMDFVLQNRIRYILFNDNCYYGVFHKLDSGYQLLNLLIQKLRAKGCVLEAHYRLFANDSHYGLEGWKCHASNELLFQDIDANSYTLNIDYCKSKQVLIHLNAS